MDIKVWDFLLLAREETDGIAIRDCSPKADHKPQYMAVMTAREGFGDYNVIQFSVGPDVFGHGQCLHLWVDRD